ncbi:MAG: hypothetical protein ACPGXL_01080 [Chitinophagales bacterium]
MIQLFRTNHPITLLLLVVYIVVVNAELFINPPVLMPAADGILGASFYNFWNWVSGNNYYVLNIIFLFLLFIQALLLNYIINKYKIFGESTSLPALCYVLLMALFARYVYINPVLFANFGTLFLIDKIYGSYNTKEVASLFDAGLIVGVCSLIYMPYIVLVVLLLLALSIVRVFAWKEWVITLFGVLVPYFLVGSVLFYIDELPLLFSGFVDVSSQTGLVNASEIGEMVNIPSTMELIIKIATCFIIAITGLLIYQEQFMRSIVKIRKYLLIQIYLISVMVLSFLLLKQISLTPIALIVIPLSVFLSNVFYSTKQNTLAELVHLSILFVLLFFQYT